MSKLQPNFSWQKYEGKPEQREEQFQYRLQQMHVVTANAINATIDDISYTTQQRLTGETWIDGKAIWRVSVVIPTLPNAAGTLQVAHGIDFTKVSNFVNLEGIAYDPVTPLVAPLYFANYSSLAGMIGVFLDATYINVKVGQDRSGFTNNSITIWFTKK